MCIVNLKRFAAEGRFWRMHTQHMAETQGVPQLDILQMSTPQVTCCQGCTMALSNMWRSFLRSVDK